MYQLKSLINKLEENLKEFNIFETIDIKTCNEAKYQFQINNLVKHQRHKQIKDIISSTNKIIKEEDIVSSFEVTDKNFLNLEINIKKFQYTFENIRKAIKLENKKNIILDYGGPNIGKPLHVGHLRSLNIGRSIYEINKLAGNKVTSDIHLGDWGMPIAQIITYLENESIDINSLDSSQLEIIYPKASEQYKDSEKFKIRAQEINKLLNENDSDLLEIWGEIKNISIKSLEENFSLLNHSFDYWLGESDVNELIPEMIDNLYKNKKIIDDSGALISAEDTDPKILITKSDGSYLYITTDLATILYRQNNIGYDKAFYVVDNRQSLHFKQLFDSIKFFEFNNLHHEHISYGTLNDSDGNPFKTRDGGTKPLSELFEETYEYIKNINSDLEDSIIKQLANSVLTFSDLITNRKTDYKFDLEKFTNVNGKTGIYVQYARVRAKKLQQSISKQKNEMESLVLSDVDKQLLSQLFMFGYFLEQSFSLNEPHHLANYLYDISNSFNQFYEHEKLSEIKDINHLSSKLYLINLFLTTSENVMFCLGMKPVDKM